MASNHSFLNCLKITEFLEERGIFETQEIIAELEKNINSIIVQRTKQKSMVEEQYLSSIPLSKAFLSLNKEMLPSWLKSRFNDIRILGQNTLILPDGRKYQLNNKLNDLSGGAWTYFTSSVLNTNYKTKGADTYAFNIRKIHPSPKPPQLMRDIIEFFTKENEIVLDYFMGVGGSLLGASLCNRRSIGIDLNQEYIDTYKKAASYLNLSFGTTLCGDSLEILEKSNKMSEILKGEEVSLILIDPPYSNMMSKKKTGADIAIYGENATPFTNDSRDLGNLSREDFYEKLKQSVEFSSRYLKKYGHIVIFIKDMQPNKKNTNLLHAEIVNHLNEIANIQYKGLKIWADQTAKLFPYGYPFAFVANQIHQYILIFRKEK